jgi:glycosyltransferase involved in cell wall biosynthesis
MTGTGSSPDASPPSLRAGSGSAASPRIRVAFDSRALEHPALAERGIGRYTRSLLEALEAGGHDVVALRDLRRPPAPVRLAELIEHALLARDVRRVNAQVLHSPSIDFATTRPGVPYVVTVHDLVPLKQPERYLRTGLKHRLRYAAVKRATRVIVPSGAVAADSERLLGIDRERMDVIAEAPAPVFRPVEDPVSRLGRFNLPDEFILWVGGLDPPDPRKGIRELALAAARASAPPLVLAGRISAEAADLAVPGRVLLVGRLADDDLAALFTAAAALVLPSEEEGFGLTAMEALACGTPVAAFAIEALREQYADSSDVALVESGDHAALLAAAEALTTQRATTPTRTWDDVASETWAAYESAASSV